MVVSDFNSALLSVDFDWGINANTGKRTAQQETFMYDTRRLAQGENDEESYPYDVISTKRRVRGRGKVMKIRYESNGAKDFKLLGYALLGVERGDSERNK